MQSVQKAALHPASYKEDPLQPVDLAHAIIAAIEDVKGESIVLMDLREATVLSDYFVICTGNSQRQLRAIAEKVREQVKENHSVFPRSVEGEVGSGWYLMDYLDVIVHIFAEDLRHHYDLESLWQQLGGKILLNIQ